MYIFRLEIYTGQFQISGSYALSHYQRLSDVLNSDLSPYLTLQDVILAPLERPQQAERLHELRIKRNNILLVSPLHEPDPPADYVPPGQAPHRDVFVLMFLMGAFAVQAHLTKRADLSIDAVLEREGEDCAPLTDARIIPFNHPKPLVRDFVCIGRNHIHAFYETAASASGASASESA